MNSLIKFSLRYKNFVNFIECKRFAGHSKWANIKHTKMAKDAQRSDVLRNFINKLKVAITEGKSAKPENNHKLARVIEEAKRKSMPMATIKNFLEKAQSSKIGTQSAFFESRGPAGSMVLIHLLTENIPHTRSYVNMHLKKCGFTASEMPSQNLFYEKGLIYTEVGEFDIDKAIDDAIETGAEEAEKLQEDDKEFIQFTCAASEVYKYVELSDEDIEYVSKLYTRLGQMEEVIKIYNNIQ
ncbi:translational activator of cytochrome c oxidase 1 isoform X2 [Phymastichus coffea]|uniref:translational activator of cytochrome c oxidase 1 isoform X2 n=1 Tax=Phymastichus coffea TaxID=108790 RepID=UPI00273BF3ED|nr:translational activator of cytochrome c oxidase 1 isoform X2 [Phymastichus coffea]